MRLYPKELRNIDDLEREKQFLIRKNRQMEKEDIFSIEGLLGKNKKGGKEAGGIESLLGSLPLSNPVVSLLVKMIRRKLKNYRKNNNARPLIVPPPGTDEKPAKSKVKAIAIEFISGYLKWKAIELSYKGIRHLIRKRKEKNEVI